MNDPAYETPLSIIDVTAFDKENIDRAARWQRRSDDPNTPVKHGDEFHGSNICDFYTHRYIVENRFNGSRIPGYFVQMIERWSMQCTPLSFLPARLGTDHVVDLAAEAVVSLLTNTPGAMQSSSNKAVTESEHQYGKAVIALRRSLHFNSSWSKSEHAILAIYLLIIYDLAYSTRRCSYSERRRQAESHGRGLVALLRMRAANLKRLPSFTAVGSHDLDELLRTFVYEAWSASFRGPCIRGEASAFDYAALYSIDPPAHYRLPAPVAKLLRTGNELIVRLPKLIAALGEWRRDGEDVSQLQLDPSITCLVAQLYAVRDDYGENALLHYLNVRATSSSGARSSGLSCFFQFDNMSEFKTAMIYWTGRLMIQRICILLLRNGVHIPEIDVDIKDIHKKASAVATNIVMCVEHGQQLGFHASKLLLCGLSSVWGLLNDIPTFRDKASADMRPYILDSLSGIGEHVAATHTELDFIAESFIGGPTGGLKIPVLDPMYGI